MRWPKWGTSTQGHKCSGQSNSRTGSSMVVQRTTCAPGMTPFHTRIGRASLCPGTGCIQHSDQNRQHPQPLIIMCGPACWCAHTHAPCAGCQRTPPPHTREQLASQDIGWLQAKNHTSNRRAGAALQTVHAAAQTHSCSARLCLAHSPKKERKSATLQHRAVLRCLEHMKLCSTTAWQA